MRRTVHGAKVVKTPGGICWQIVEEGGGQLRQDLVDQFSSRSSDRRSGSRAKHPYRGFGIPRRYEERIAIQLGLPTNFVHNSPYQRLRITMPDQLDHAQGSLQRIRRFRRGFALQLDHLLTHLIVLSAMPIHVAPGLQRLNDCAHRLSQHRQPQTVGTCHKTDTAHLISPKYGKAQIDAIISQQMDQDH